MAKPPRRRVAAVAQVLVSAVAAANDDSIVTLALGVNPHSFFPAVTNNARNKG